MHFLATPHELSEERRSDETASAGDQNPTHGQADNRGSAPAARDASRSPGRCSRQADIIPTRDRLTLLRSAVDSVLRLDDEDCELVISDNASSEYIAEYVESLSDPRVVYARTPRPLAVTDNWNNALEHSSGDYVIMLGDDDALLGTYFSRTRKLIAEFDRPEVVYHNALVYAYPGVVPDEPDGLGPGQPVDPGCESAQGPQARADSNRLRSAPPRS
jgi:hypothetical protein